MVSATEHASWPSTTISPETKHLINLFFSLVDQKDSSVGDRLATEVFAEDGSMIAGTAAFNGRAAIRKCRERAWDVVTARRHDISNVYASDAEGTDLLMIGTMLATVPNGNVAEVSFVGRFIIQKSTDGLRLKLYQAWSDQTPIQNALKDSR